MSELELYDWTRGQWKVRLEKAKQVQLAFAVYHGTIQEVYQVLDWYETASALSLRGNDHKTSVNEKEKKHKGRYEFIGNFATDKIRKKYKYKSVDHYFRKGNANPIMYLNIE